MAWTPWIAEDAPEDVPRAERRTCRDCWRDFFVSPAEKRFMEERGLAMPARCADCREMRRKVRHANEADHV